MSQATARQPDNGRNLVPPAVRTGSTVFYSKLRLGVGRLTTANNKYRRPSDGLVGIVETTTQRRSASPLQRETPLALDCVLSDVE